MASNKNALIRYKTIDQCLRNTFRTWTLDDLIEACSDALYEYEGKDVYVSKRTVQLDIQMMRSDKLGYNAPIEVYQRKYYRYAEEDYSIMNIPVTDHDIKIMNESIQILRQFKDFSLFKEMNGVLERLEDSVYATQKNNKPIIHLEKNEQLKGLHHIDILYHAILDKKVLKITYRSFKARQPSEIEIHPQLLKEFNNRWFLLAVGHNRRSLTTFALDRIIGIATSDKDIAYVDHHIDGDHYYKDVIGVTVSENVRPERISFRVDHRNAPYVTTKPFHSSQKTVLEDDRGVTFSIEVQMNFELERLILGFGDSIEVLQPEKLRNRIQEKLKRAVKKYT
ncbi:helix-turn-helix transcriptional regulator [Aquimarina litoralis]|uniref:helix-turn-helix transcriptional regulator n=1 Tax=Aquimarina litoralis TaxID=584605 RepID=UPI001C58E061|nr:WYL domain-containing protein [Aquimarina litoralis]MBW1297862.1 WYL domain-containing protein [Aquimarina litoralis]